MNTAGWLRDRRLVQSRTRGAVLLEVILALGLFAAAAGIVTAALQSSLNNVQRQKLRLHACNLAISLVSELEIGLRSAGASGPESFPAPYEDWTWQLLQANPENVAASTNAPRAIEVVIRHAREPDVFRLRHDLPAGQNTVEPGSDLRQDEVP